MSAVAPNKPHKTRKPAEPSATKTVLVTFLASPEEHAGYQDAAKADGRSMANWIRHVLATHVRERKP